MRKELLVGLAALLVECSPTQLTSTVPMVVQQRYQYLNIIIDGPPDYAQRTTQALDLIYYYDKNNWVIVQDNITAIRLNPPSGIYVHTGVFDTDANITTPTSYQPVQWVAGEIVHDAWHREYFRRGESYKGWEGEKKCMERQNEFFQKIGYKQVNIEQMLKSRYWEVQPRTW